MSPVMVQAVRQVFGELGRLGRGPGTASRTERDLPMRGIFAGVIAVAVLLFLYFRFAVLANAPDPTTISLAALGLALGVSFLFAAVSAWAIAMIGTTPISGMTLTTLILAAVALSSLGLSGEDGMLAVLLIGGVVCTALSMTGSMVTMLKVGYWTGASPRRIELTLIAGSVVAAITVTAVMYVLNGAYGFVKTPEHPDPLVAPQANAMAAVLGSVMAEGGTPWFLYGVGAVVSIVIECLGVSSLAFALGMYLPIDLNTPILAGGIVAWLVGRPAGSEALVRARINRGTLIASGFIAGGALAGVLDGVIKFGTGGESLVEIGNDGAGGNWLGLAIFAAIGAYLWADSRRATEAEGSGPQISL
jgi:putative OPT family oligopeptide transporter